MHLRTVLTLLLASLWCPPIFAAGYGDQTSKSTVGKVTTARRERNLDHWDSDTLAYYLDEYRGYDVAVLFYAQWDRNSHALAPYWDKIATKLDAGNSKSRLIMSLFDCEFNLAHGQLCKALNVDAYPTMMFIGSGPYHDTDPLTKSVFGKKSVGIMGESSVSNTVKFQGNWQYTDSILDWIRTMQALSNWHTWSTKGFGRRLRNFLIPRSIPNTPLPVGIPGSSKPASSTTSGTSVPAQEAVASAKTEALEQQVKQLTNQTKELEKHVQRGTTLLNSMLVPVTDKDMFTVFEEHNIWDRAEQKTATAEEKVLYTCVAQIALDYCQRVSTKVATDMVKENEAKGISLNEMMKMESLEKDIMDRVSKDEEYCGAIDQCIVNEFRDESCRPKTCPFKNEAACSYLTACLNEDLLAEYAQALGISFEEASTGTSPNTGGQTKSGWGA